MSEGTGHERVRCARNLEFALSEKRECLLRALGDEAFWSILKMLDFILKRMNFLVDYFCLNIFFSDHRNTHLLFKSLVI